MAFVSFGNSLSVTDPYSTTGDKRIILSHPNVTDQLIVTEFNNYNPNWENFLVSGDRTLVGSLQISGRNRIPDRTVSVDCIVTQAQLDIFEEIKRQQDATLTPVTIQDRFKPIVFISGLMASPTWLSGSPTNNDRGKPTGFVAFTVFLDVDANYSTFISGDWYQLQFQLSGI